MAEHPAAQPCRAEQIGAWHLFGRRQTQIDGGPSSHLRLPIALVLVVAVVAATGNGGGGIPSLSIPSDPNSACCWQASSFRASLANGAPQNPPAQQQKQQQL
jgi:hypothetical protein